MSDYLPGQAVGSTDVMRQLEYEIGVAAGSDAHVLIVGERGTGKEFVARAIHNRSRRAGGNFVDVNCPGLPETLLEAELFGHEKGAYTGAERERKGII